MQRGFERVGFASSGGDEAMREENAAAARGDTQEELLEGFGVNAGIVAEIRQRYELDPRSVHASWARLFEPERDHDAEPLPEEAPGVEPSLASPQVAEKYARVLRMIHAYRARGHRIADTDPLGSRVEYFPELDPAHYGLGKDDESKPFFAGDLPGGPIQTLAQILDRLRATYCRRVGVEFTHIQDPGKRQWLMRRMEESQNATPLSAEEQLRVLEKICAAELFERFLHTKFVGQKRFSLEGAESLIGMLDALVEEAAELGAEGAVAIHAERGGAQKQPAAGIALARPRPPGRQGQHRQQHQRQQGRPQAGGAEPQDPAVVRHVIPVVVHGLSPNAVPCGARRQSPGMRAGPA